MMMAAHSPEAWRSVFELFLISLSSSCSSSSPFALLSSLYSRCRHKSDKTAARLLFGFLQQVVRPSKTCPPLVSCRTSTSFATKSRWSTSTLANSEQQKPPGDFVDFKQKLHVTCTRCANSVCVCVCPITHTCSYMQLLLELVWVGRGSWVVQWQIRRPVFRRRRWLKEASRSTQWGLFWGCFLFCFVFFCIISCSESPPLWNTPLFLFLSLGLYLSQLPVVPWLMPWSSLETTSILKHTPVFCGMRYVVQNVMCSFYSLWFFFFCFFFLSFFLSNFFI